MKAPSFSARLTSVIGRMLMFFIAGTGAMISIYLIGTVRQQINETQSNLQSQLRQDIKRIINYGEIIQLQPILTEAANNHDDSTSLYLELKAQAGQRVLAYSGDRNAQAAFFKKVSIETIGVPLYGDVDIRITQEYGRKLGLLLVGVLAALLIMALFTWLILRAVEQRIALQSVGLDDLENALLSANENGPEDTQFTRAAGIIKSYADTKAKIAVAERTSMLAKQVAHDIRSPLSALNMVSSVLTEVPEEKRSIIKNAVKRINDIANDLLARSKQGSVDFQLVQLSDQASKSQQSIPGEPPVDLWELVQSLVAEKKFQFQSSSKLKFTTDIGDGSHGDGGHLVTADSKQLQRAISNLVNNAVESLPNAGGEITIFIRVYRDKIHLGIKDNGSGIPPEVLEQLGQVGITHGKDQNGESGNGLGVFHAKKTVESSGGFFGILSQVGVGTQVDIHLPRVTAGS